MWVVKLPSWLPALRAAAALVLALLFAAPLQAQLRPVAPGAAVELAADEGLLLLAVNSDIALDHVGIGREDRWFGGGALRRLQAGPSYQLYVLPRGRYHWSEIRAAWRRYPIRRREDFRFAVEAGVVNYPGHLIHRFGRDLQAPHVANRALLALDWLERHHPDVFRARELVFAGRYPDPFPAQYRAARLARVAVPAAAEPVAPVLPLAIDTLWRPAQVGPTDLNPHGDLLAVVLRQRVDDRSQWVVDLVEPASQRRVHVFRSERPIRRLDWSGDRALLVSEQAGAESDQVHVLRVGRSASGAPRLREHLRLPRLGQLVDAPPHDPGRILFASDFRQLGRSSRHVHRLDITSQAVLDAFRFRPRDALDDGVGDDLAWFTDGRGRLRGAIVARAGGSSLMHRQRDRFAAVASLEDAAAFSPLALSRDGRTYFGLLEEGRAQRELVEFDPATGRVGRTLHSRPGVDVQGALFDAQRRVIGATYYEQGQLASHYFEPRHAAVQRELQQRFAGRSVSILDRDDAGRGHVVLVSGSDLPPEVHHYDAVARRLARIERARPWLQDAPLAPSQVLHARSRDGYEIEAYLTVPVSRQADARLPLVVFPHGGPIGVRDLRVYDPEVQFLAALGYAVLQVNFRGSEGFGNSFRDAARGAYGSAIEDDIDAAIAVALRDHPLDPARMCTLGSSYGGYSALMATIRSPGRYRCAVSISGLSDQQLFFTASDAGRSAEGRAELLGALGDPAHDAASMQARSPLYRVAAMTAPVMLVHGRQDWRVDEEHTRRLARMLQLSGRAPVVLSLPREGHGIEEAENRERTWQGIAGFLQAHLGGPPPTRAVIGAATARAAFDSSVTGR